MKKIHFVAACIAVAISVISCTKEQGIDPTVLKDKKVITSITNADSTSHSGGDDDKPIIMRFPGKTRPSTTQNGSKVTSTVNGDSSSHSGGDDDKPIIMRFPGKINQATL